MKDHIISCCLITVAVLCLYGPQYYMLNKLNNSIASKENSKIEHNIENDKPSFYNKSPKEGLMEALEYYEVKHPKTVYAQAVLETGHFKSNLCINYNNLFGLYNSKTKQFFKFEHWSESVVAYINCVQYKYKSDKDYYTFLKDLGYAEDPDYIEKVKRIESRHK